MWTTGSANYTWHGDEPPPSFGVREPRKPKPPSLGGGAAAEPHFEPEPPPPYREVVSGVTASEGGRLAVLEHAEALRQLRDA